MNSVEKRVDDVERDSISVPSVPGPSPAGDFITGAAVATVTMTSDLITGATVATVTMISDCEPGSGEVHQPVSSNVLNAINISEPVDVPAFSVSSTPSSTPSNGAPVQVENYVSRTTPMEVDGPPSPALPSSPIECAPGANESSAMSSDGPLVKPIHSMDLDAVDFSKIPAWLGPPLLHLQKEFRGDLEDKLLGGYVALEMAWQPVSA